MREATGEQATSPERQVRDWQAGIRREQSFRALFERFNEPLANFFTNRGFPDAEARELTQDVFQRAHRGMPAFRFDSSVATWIFNIAKNLWLNAERERHSRKRSAEEVPLDAARDHGETEGARRRPASWAWSEAPQLKDLIVEERHRWLRDAVASLTPKERRVALLVLQDRDYAEIGVILRIPLGTVKSRMASARSRLRELLAEAYPDFSL